MSRHGGLSQQQLDEILDNVKWGTPAVGDLDAVVAAIQAGSLPQGSTYTAVHILGRASRPSDEELVAVVAVVAGAIVLTPLLGPAAGGAAAGFVSSLWSCDTSDNGTFVPGTIYDLDRTCAAISTGAGAAFAGAGGVFSGFASKPIGACVLAGAEGAAINVLLGVIEDDINPQAAFLDAGISCATAGIISRSTTTQFDPNSTAPSAARHLCSFSGETEVLMADGTTKPISEVEVGDWVLAEDPETGVRGPRRVTHLWVHQDTIVDLEIAGHDVATTEDHPFWNATDGEWQRADVLDAGDLVVTAEGSTLIVDGVDWRSARTTTAYNLTVDDIHTYFVQVGSDEVLVHNSNTCRDLWQLTREGAESTRRHGRFGTFYETVNRHGDSMWLTTDTAQHGGSFFKMYEETGTGLRWVADLDEYGDIIVGKHKSDVGSFIPWSELGR